MEVQYANGPERRPAARPATLAGREDASIEPADAARELADEKLNRRLNGARLRGLALMSISAAVAMCLVLSIYDLSAEALLAVYALLKA
jgi:hypothetical protein